MLDDDARSALPAGGEAERKNDGRKRSSQAKSSLRQATQEGKT
jgi:hypothetical protein